jgi:acetyl esterase/lipase
MIVAGLDPLRDDAIRFTKKLVNAGVDIHAVEYRYLLHCFVEHDKPPYDQEEAKLAMARSTEFINELIN